MLSYKDFVTDNEHQHCWSCGRDGYQPNPAWGGVWYLQRAHLGAGSGSMLRQKDVRAVVILCPLCHHLHCNLTFMKVNGCVYPTLQNKHMLWLKQVMDPIRYSPEYLKEVWMGCPPLPEAVPMFFESSYMVHRGQREGVSPEP